MLTIGLCFITHLRTWAPSSSEQDLGNPFSGQALLVLEAAQHSRTRSAPIRLAAMSLHGMLGAATSAMDSFDALDIKHIQHDTLSGKRLCSNPKCNLVASVHDYTPSPC